MVTTPTWRDVRGTRRLSADDLVSTESERAALDALRAATREVDGAMERHTVRQYLIAERIADARGVRHDREILLCASFLHDAGLYRPSGTGDAYIQDSVRYAREVLEPFGWSAERLRVCLNACEQHHAFRSRERMGAEVELVRLSDLVEVVPELVRHGVPRRWLRHELFRAVPRNGFWPGFAELLRAHWRRMLPGMFRPGPGVSL